MERISTKRIKELEGKKMNEQIRKYTTKKVIYAQLWKKEKIIKTIYKRKIYNNKERT